MTAMETRRLPRLPACRHCSTKKIKCDSNRPKCHICAKMNAECVMFDSASQDWVSREYIDKLEKSAGDVFTGSAPAIQHPSVSDQHTSPALASPEKVHTGRSLGSSTTIQRGAGMSFVSLLFSDAEWRRSNADLLKSLTQPPQAPEQSIEPCSLPSEASTHELFDKYLSWSHILNPVLLRDEVWGLHRRLFSGDANISNADPHDLFRAFIICAIAAVIPYRTGTHPQHPGGYYRAALHSIGPYLLTRGIESIQDLLLIGRYGVYHHIGISIWELVQLCGRLCLEQGLHCGDAETGNLLHDQKIRRVFWQVYIIDRYSSITLDRPFAIDDSSIEIGLPADANDNDLAATSPSIGSLDEFSKHSISAQHTEVTSFLCCVRLRKLSSRINGQLSTLRQDPSLHAQPYLAVGRICTVLNGLLQELEDWYQSAPAVSNPQCLYESNEWFMLLFCRERIDLIRRAVDLIPKNNGAPPRHVVSLFLRAALQIIHNYSTLSERRGFITYTRNYFHMMFTAGLSVMYCTSVSQHLTQTELLELSHGLRTCEATLSKMSEQLTYARAYTAVFAALHRHISVKIHRASGMAPPEGSEPQGHANSSVEIGGMTNTFAGPIGTPQFYHHARPGHDAGSLVQGSLNVTDGAWQNTPLGDYGNANMFNGGVPTNHINGNTFHGGNGGPVTADDDLLHWAFLHDESVWNMDLMLGEYVYGDPVQSGPLNGVQM